MTHHELWGPWLGDPITPSQPYSVRRKRFWRAFTIIAICAFTFCALMGLSH